jgi:predicted nuclease of predicted toxin-antitoxin system
LKLLFDQNISPKIVRQVESDFPDSKQVRHVGLEDASDVMIFDYAKSHGYAVVTFDADFVDLNVVRGIPPKIIWLKTGNLTTKSISELLKNNISAIHDFLESEDEEILEIIRNAP